MMFSRQDVIINTKIKDNELILRSDINAGSR